MLGQKAPQTKAEKEKQRSMFEKREKEALDEMLRQQGIDIDALDEQFGSELDDIGVDETVITVDENEVVFTKDIKKETNTKQKTVIDI
jgi:hypothetical protein